MRADATRSISRSRSRKGRRRRRASALPTVVLPAPMKPATTIARSLRARVPREPCEVCAVGGQHVVDVVAAERLSQAARELERDDRLGDDGGCRDGRRVGALDERVGRFVGVEPGRAQRLHQGRDGLHRDPHDDRLAVRHAALDAARAVRRAVVAARIVVEELVVHLGAPQRRVREARSDLHPLHRLDPERSGGEPRVETQARLGVRAEPRRRSEDAHLEQAAERVAVDAGAVDRLDHAARGLGVRAADLALHRAVEGRLVGSVLRRGDVADLDHAPAHADLARRQQRLRERARGDSRGRLARRCALEHVADVVVAVLERAGEVGVTRARQHDGPRAAGGDLGELARP